MDELSLQISFFLVGAAVMLALLGLGAAVLIPAADRWSKRFFIVYFSTLVVYTVIGTAEQFIITRSGMQSELSVVGYFESLFASFLILLLAAYLLHCCHEKWQRSPLFCALAALWTVYFIILDITPFTTWFYYYTPENEFCRGPFYFLLVILIDAINLLILAGLIRRRSRLSRRYYYSFLIVFLPLTVIGFIHFFVSVFFFLAICIVVCAITMYVLILSEQIDQTMRQQREIAHQRASIMVLQMRPHFIYNTMMSIYYLCKQDADLAQRVTLDFTAYLRKNFTALASDELIPFSDELEHTRAYLAVEQTQFEDTLFVDYDTPHTDFRLPPLTLQPIAENAVKHGMDPDAEPLHILIRTRQTGSGSEIIVENNGADFEPSDDSEPHIALKNIQQRLAMMCRGELEVTPREGGGTVVKVTIPDRHS